MKYVLQTIPHASQRYETCGDYYTDEGGVNRIFVSDMGNEDYEFLVLIHELTEQYLCKKHGVSEEAITAFDIDFENKRAEGNIDEPGDDNDAPYRDEHCIATGVERVVAGVLGVKWNEYEAAMLSL
jgi:hypothetical protein